VISQLDLVATVGLNAANNVTLPVHVTDGILDLAFRSVVDEVQVNTMVVKAH
jgi:hypothetical protein